ncbi:MAG: T9SS type A sorting domain-containing protein, partial [Chitinophagaceae bacterium]
TNITVANITGTFPGFLDGGNTTVYTLQRTFTAEAGVTYEITVIAATPGDQDPSNDTLKQLVTIQNKPTHIDATARICGGSAILRVNNAVNGANYFWYDSPTSTTPIARGSNTNTTKLNSGNTYYVSSGARAKTGLTSKDLFPNGGGYLTSNSTNYLNYTSTVPLILESARLYIRYPGKINFYAADLVNNFFTFLSQVTIDVYATSADPQPGAQGTNFDNADTGAIYQLNLPLPAGSHLILAIPQGDANIFRHNNIPETNNTYPITVPELISITGNGANPQNSFYYYLYDMKVKTADCVSDRFLAAASVAPTPTITQVGDTLISSIPIGNQWFSGVGGTSLIGGATAQKFRPSGSGYYSVAITDNLGCRRTSSDFTYLATATNPTPANSDWIVGPNPSNGSFRIQWNTNERAALTIQLVDISGKIVQETNFKDFTGRLNLPYKINNPTNGSYWLQLQHGKTRFKKLIQVHN